LGMMIWRVTREVVHSDKNCPNLEGPMTSVCNISCCFSTSPISNFLVNYSCQH
jgi:hypothetical protein